MAFALATGQPFLTQSVSLVGFSLGNQVIKSCLKTLHMLGATEIIHNVTFMGGAVDRIDRPKSRELWAQILSSILSGEVKNVYTKKDLILLLYSMCETAFSQGRSTVFERRMLGSRRTNLHAEEESYQSDLVIASEDDWAFRLRNYNIWSLKSSSFFGLGHLQYRDQLRLILEYI